MKKIKLHGRFATVYFTTDRKEFEKKTKKDTRDSDGWARWTDGNFYLGVFDGKLTTLVHELYHVMFHLHDRIGEKPENYNSENNACLIEYLFDKFRAGLK